MGHFRKHLPSKLGDLPAGYTYIECGESGGKVVVYAEADPETEGLPGEYVSDDFADMHAATRANVERVEYMATRKVQPGDGREVQVRCLRGEAPEGATLTREELLPSSTPI